MSKSIPLPGDLITSNLYGENNPFLVTDVDKDKLYIRYSNGVKDTLCISSYNESWWIVKPKEDLPTQVGGDHYSKLGISPIQIIEANGLDFFEGNAVKYLLRYKEKNGAEDLKKAIWYIDYLITREIEQESE